MIDSTKPYIAGIAATTEAEQQSSRSNIMALFHLPLVFFFFFFVLSSLSLTTTTTAAAAGSGEKRDKTSTEDLVRSSCAHASYPDVCLRTLSSYAGGGGRVETPRELAQAAVRVSLSRAGKVSEYLAGLVKVHHHSQGREREEAALRDCVEQIGESVEDLRKTLEELKHLRRSGTSLFRWQMSNAETWVSAALTNEDTCLDGFTEISNKDKDDVHGKKKKKKKKDMDEEEEERSSEIVKRKMKNVGRVTSNALYLINRLDDDVQSPQPLN